MRLKRIIRWAQAAVARTLAAALAGVAPAGAAFGYVSSDGSVRLSAEVVAELGVRGGGGVVILKRAGHPHVEILTHEQFAALLHEKAPHLPHPRPR